VRCGPNYAVSKQKQPSAPSIYEVVAVDAYSTEQKLPHLGRVLALPDDPPDDLAAADLGLPPYLLVNFMIPSYAPSSMMASQRKVDGPGWNVVLCARLTKATRSALREGRVSPSVNLLQRFMDPLHGAPLRKERLKCLFGTTDLKGPGFNLVTKQLLQKSNHKPVLSKTASSFFLVPGVRPGLRRAGRVEQRACTSARAPPHPLLYEHRRPACPVPERGASGPPRPEILRDRRRRPHLGPRGAAGVP
jgi:hypothetical protein